MQKHRKLSRREFVKASTATIATIPLLSILGQRAWSAERISESHPTAVALGYVHDGEKVDASQNPTFKADQRCDNCVQYVATGGGGLAIFSLDSKWQALDGARSGLLKPKRVFS